MALSRGGGGGGLGAKGSRLARKGDPVYIYLIFFFNILPVQCRCLLLWPS